MISPGTNQHMTEWETRKRIGNTINNPRGVRRILLHDTFTVSMEPILSFVVVMDYLPYFGPEICFLGSVIHSKTEDLTPSTPSLFHLCGALRFLALTVELSTDA